MPGRQVAPRRKAELRRLVRERRSAHLVDQPEAADALARAVLGLQEVGTARTVAAYVAYGTEPPTDVLIERLVSRGVDVVLPVLLPDLDLDWASHDGRLVAGPRQSLEPLGPRLGPAALRTADVVVVPALAVARDGARLGQGGGSYDRALAQVSSATLLVALLWSDAELLDAGAIPTDAWDVAVRVVVTPHAVTRLV